MRKEVTRVEDYYTTTKALHKADDYTIFNALLEALLKKQRKTK